MKTLLSLIFLIAVQVQAKSLLEIKIGKETSLYASPSLDSKILQLLKVGDVVTAQFSEKKYFLQILDKPGGGRTLGYIHTPKIKGFKIKRLPLTQVTREQTVDRPGYKQNYGLGLRYYSVQMKQSAYSELINEVTYEFSEFESHQPSYGLQISLPSSTQWNFRINLIQRATSFQAHSKIKNVPSSHSIVTREQKLLGLGLDMNYYLFRNLYLLFGLEASKGTEVKIQFGSQTLATGKNELPFFVLTKLGVGYDFHVFKNIYINPEIELGFDMNSDPLTHYISISLGTNFTF